MIHAINVALCELYKNVNFSLHVNMTLDLKYCFRSQYVCSHGTGTLITSKLALYKIIKMKCFNKRQTAYNDYKFAHGAGGSILYINLGKI